MPRNPEWYERNFKPAARGERRRDSWPEGYHMVLRARMLTIDDLIAIARRFCTWPIPTQHGLAFTPEDAALLWRLGDEWVTDTGAGRLTPHARFTGTVINPDGEAEHRVDGEFSFRDPSDRPGTPVKQTGRV